MAYDAERCEVVFFGGTGMDDTWTWDGARWTQRHPLHHPVAAKVQVAAYDPNRKVIVLVESPTPGVNGGVTTWTWDGTDWQLQKAAHQPSVGVQLSLIFVPDVAKLVSISSGSQSWEWDGQDWIPNATPPAPGIADIVYDSKLRTPIAVTMGGGPDGPMIWRLVPDTALASGARSNGALSRWELYPKGTGQVPDYPIGKAVYDDAIGKIIYFKGRGVTAGASYQTWTWDDGTWELWPPGQQPRGFFRSSATYDSTRRSLVFFGGTDDYGTKIATRNQTWVLTTSGWTQVG
jgi:hypothetical protein